RRLFILVGPAAIVGESFAIEKLGIVGRRLIHQHEQYLTFDIHILVVVPVELGGVDTITNPDEVGVDIVTRVAGLVGGYEVGAIRQLEGSAAFGNQAELGVVLRGNAFQRHLLHECSVFTHRFQSIQGELRGDVFGGDFTASLASATTFKQIAGEKAH